MKSSGLRSAIIDALTKAGDVPSTPAQIAKAIRQDAGGSHKLRGLLKKMAEAGEIVAIRKNRYCIGREADLMAGRLEIVRSGDGFVTGDCEKEAVRVPARFLGTGLPGDTVMVRVTPTRRNDDPSRRGKVVRIVARGNRHVVGTLRTTGRFLYVVPMEPTYRRDFYVPKAEGGKVGDRVVVELTKWDDKHLNPEGEIIEVIGPATDASLDTLSVIRQYGYSDGFSQDVVRDANTAAQRMKQPGVRLDLRDEFVFTIDPVTARDFDDALSLRQDKKGRSVLGIHIADVSHFVPLGGAVDREARLRGNSVYFPDRVLPMLPEELSNGVCSLVPDEDRFAFSVFITVDKSGSPVSSEFARTLIRSKLRLSYRQAMEALSAPTGRACKGAGMTASDVKLLKFINRIAQQFRRRRVQQDALDLDVPEYKVVMRDDGSVADVREMEHDLSHQLVEECMIAANEAVDAELSQRGIPLIHRIHEPPAEEKLAELTAGLTDMGLDPGDLSSRRNLVQFLATVKDGPLARHIMASVLRSMSKAVYSAKPKGHYGLAKQFYAHFTSPIRRYPDLVVHRILALAILSKKTVYEPVVLESVAKECSQTEQRATIAERVLVEIKKLRFLEQELQGSGPEAHEAVVVHVANFGMFVELVDLQIQGLVHVSTLSDKFVRHDAPSGTLRAGKRVYKLGDKLAVLATKVDMEKRRVDFVPVLATQARPRSKRASRRKKS